MKDVDSMGEGGRGIQRFEGDISVPAHFGQSHNARESSGHWLPSV